MEQSTTISVGTRATSIPGHGGVTGKVDSLADGNRYEHCADSSYLNGPHVSSLGLVNSLHGKGVFYMWG